MFVNHSFFECVLSSDWLTKHCMPRHKRAASTALSSALYHDGHLGSLGAFRQGQHPLVFCICLMVLRAYMHRQRLQANANLVPAQRADAWLWLGLLQLHVHSTRTTPLQHL